MRTLLTLSVMIAMVLLGIVGSFLVYCYSSLPDIDSVKDFELQVPLRIFSKDGKLIAEYGEKRRLPKSIKAIPQPLIDAVLATEDRRFYHHRGVDLKGLVRAGVTVLSEGRKAQGGSTITMQVARNFFLTRKKTYTRKINEILLAIKIERELTKSQILELYLNKVFLGYRAYGVAAAARVYYGKAVDELNLAQMAMIAGLPKAPSAINPIVNPRAARARRAHVLSKMLEMAVITRAEYQAAVNAPITARYHGKQLALRAPYVAEMVRRILVHYVGETAYSRGFQVYTTIDSTLQTIANNALSNGLLHYDQRHGLRPLAQAPPSRAQWPSFLATKPVVADLQPGIVSQVSEQGLEVYLSPTQTVSLSQTQLQWALSRRKPSPSAWFHVGALIYLAKNTTGYRLAQLPEVEGALVALAPHDGAVLALTGGFDYYRSKFNRVTQAELQPGSNLKPFIYSAAIEHGFTAASLINDAPIVLDDPSLDTQWRPENDNNTFNGPTTLRNGLIRSRNLVSIRLLSQVGIPYTRQYLTKFGFKLDHIPNGLSLALGTASVNPLEVVRAYAILANGGQKITPYFIERIERNQGEVIFQAAPKVACSQCNKQAQAEQSIEPRNAFIMTNILQDNIQRGTGRAAKQLGRTDLAGKTGTTNDQYDAWFSGYNANIALTVWVGFDKPRSLHEYAAKAALPIWIDFMRQALAGQPTASPKQPNGLTMVRINPKTGALSHGQHRGAVFEIFREEKAPNQALNSNSSPPFNDHSQASPEHIF